MMSLVAHLEKHKREDEGEEGPRRGNNRHRLRAHLVYEHYEHTLVTSMVQQVTNTSTGCEQTLRKTNKRMKVKRDPVEAREREASDNRSRAWSRDNMV